MAKRIVTKIGDVFSVKLPDGTKGHFQFVAIDKSCLSSSLIRAFKKRYALNETPSIDEIVHGEVAFYAHAILRQGIVDGVWEKIGKSDFLDNDRIDEITFTNQVMIPLFHEGREYPVETILWRTWKNSKPDRYLRFPPLGNKQIEIGTAFHYINIIRRFERGYYPLDCPEYELLKRNPWPDYNSYTKQELQGQMVYFHFLGEKLMREVVVADGKRKCFSADNKKRSFFGLKTAKAFPCDIEFSDINWAYDNFITEEDFNNVWDGCRK